MPIISNPPVGDGGHGELHYAERFILNTLDSRILPLELSSEGVYNTVQAPENPADDASELIQDAIDRASPAGEGYGLVQLSSGTFRIATGLSIPREGVAIRGMGMGPVAGATILKPDAGVTCFTVTNTATYANVGFSNFCINGGGIGIYFEPVDNPTYDVALWCYFRQLFLRNQTVGGMLVECPLYWAHFDQVRFANSPYGLKFDSTTPSHVNQFDVCSWNNCTTGLDADALKFSLFDTCHWEGNDAAILLKNCAILNFINSYFEHNGDPVDEAHTPDVQVGQVGGGAPCWGLYWYGTYTGPHNHQPGDIPHVWLKVLAANEGLQMQFINHNDYDNSIVWGDGTTTWSQSVFDYKMGHILLRPSNYLYMYDTATGALKQLKVTNGNLVIT